MDQAGVKIEQFGYTPNYMAGFVAAALVSPLTPHHIYTRDTGIYIDTICTDPLSLKMRNALLCEAHPELTNPRM
jgi:hypothetical protein